MSLQGVESGHPFGGPRVLAASMLPNEQQLSLREDLGVIYGYRLSGNILPLSSIAPREDEEATHVVMNSMSSSPAMNASEEDPSEKKAGGSSIVCKDCGNQAKKDCGHMRCRTCCKNQGFDCPTHVKSTWVPASKRRERQHPLASSTARFNPRSKRAQTLAMACLPNAATAPLPTSSDLNSTQVLHQETSVKTILPAKVRAPAVFKCVRVTGADDGVDEFAYQAIVKIGGHIFKGMLFDQGSYQEDGSSIATNLELHGRSVSSNSALVDPNGICGASGSSFLGGTSYLAAQGALTNENH